jgi:hypothetical protein
MTPARRSTAARLAAAWNDYWFAPMSPGPLGVCRIIFFGTLLVRVAPEVESSAWAEMVPVFWMPTDLFAKLHLGPLPAAWLGALDWVWRGALALACIGLWTRAATAVAFLIGVYLLGLAQCFGKVDHWSGLLVLVMGVLALARAGDAWSVDALLYGRQPGTAARAPLKSGEYRWPIQFARLLVVLVFFAAGIAKLRLAGLAWASPENIRAILIFPHYANDRALPSIGLALSAWPVACGLFGALALAFELGCPLALLGGRLAAAIVGGLFLMQIGIATLLGVHASFPYLGCYAFWIPWGAWEVRAAGAAFARVTRFARAT